jgi:hypothetical protein
LSFCFALKTYLCLKIITDEFTNNYRTSLGNRALLQEETTTKAIREVIELLDAGKLR